MPFSRPTPQSILARIQASIDVYLPGSDARLRNSAENVLAKVLTLASNELYGYLSWIANQILPDTADTDTLERIAAVWGIDRNPATAAIGHVQFTGTDGTVIAAGSALTSNSNILYKTDADITVVGVTGSGTVTADISNFGAQGNAAIGTKLTLQSPVAGAVSAAVVIDDGSGQGLTDGVDIETDDALRARVIRRIQTPPMGGDADDYVTWAMEISGVTRVWVYPLQLGLGTVEIIFVMDNNPITIIPSGGEIAAVQAHLDAVAPVTADVTVIAPTQLAIDFDISLNPNTVAVQNAVKAEIIDFLNREGTPGATLYWSRINEVISAAAGEFDHILNSPTENQVLDFASMPIPGVFTWSST